MASTRIGSWTWVPELKALRQAERSVPLTEREADLLTYLAERPGVVVSQEELLQQVWEYSTKVRSRAVAHTLGRLRKKLGDDGALLVTVYGHGVRLELEDDGGLVGRAALRREAVQRFEREGALVLYGVGGVGKTSLARALLAEESTLWIVAEPLHDADALMRSVARALELEPNPVTRGVLRVALRRAESRTLVLDGAENLPDDVEGLLREWLQASRVRLLVTSRRLGWNLPGLLVPPLPADAAARLFVQRATVVQPRDPMPAELVHEVVELVDGLPLAIELAAARLRVLELPALLDRLVHDVNVLGGRERSLTAILAGAWSMLDDAEQTTLAMMALFPGPVLIDELTDLVELPEMHLLDALTGLIRAALVMEDRPRFDLLDLVRTFARSRASQEQLERFVRASVARAREVFEWAYTRPRDMAEALTVEAPRWTSALEYATEPADRAALALSVRSRDVVFGQASRMQELLGQLDVAELPPELAVDVLVARAAPDAPGSASDRLRRSTEALARSRELDDLVRQVEALSRTAFLSTMTGSEREARHHLAALEEAAAEPRLPDPLAGLSLLTVANTILHHGEHLRAAPLLTRAVDHLVDRPDLVQVARQSQARVALWLGRPEEAMRLAELTLTEAVDAGHLAGQVAAGIVLADAASQAQHDDVAHRAAQVASALAHDIDDMRSHYRLEALLADLEPDDANAIERLTAIRSCIRSNGYLQLWSGMGRLLGYRHHRRGQLDAATDLYAEALSVPSTMSRATTLRAWYVLALREGNAPSTAKHVAQLAPEAEGVRGWVSRLAAAAVRGHALDPSEIPLTRDLLRTAELARRLHDPGER